ncbi:MAG: ThuA domain-containing protein [Phycisphaerae bacterium]|nr:ThuA domain-containing protein [Phycisphaerae bacterium]
MRARQVLGFGLLLTLGSCSEQECKPCKEAHKPTEPKRVLYWTYGTDHKHDCLARTEEVVTKLGKDSGVFVATTNKGYLKNSQAEIDLSHVTPEYLNQFDAVIFYVMAQLPNSDALYKMLIDYVKSGKAFIGIHNAADQFYRPAEYNEMVGGSYAGRPWMADGPPVVITIEDKNHPATKMLPAEWKIQEEIYQIGPPYSRNNQRVLMSLNTAKTDMNKPDLLYGKNGDYAVSWCKMVGKGRLFYTSLGHSERTWNDPLFQKHLLGGIKWALGIEPGDATPNPK